MCISVFGHYYSENKSKNCYIKKNKTRSGEVQRSALHANGRWKKLSPEVVMTSGSSLPAVPNNEHPRVSL
jgi:hypothetical protein